MRNPLRMVVIEGMAYHLPSSYSEVPNRRADRNKRAGLRKNSTLPAFLLSKLINEQGEIFCLLHEKLQAGWKENLKNLSEHALLSRFDCSCRKIDHHGIGKKQIRKLYFKANL